MIFVFRAIAKCYYKSDYNHLKIKLNEEFAKYDKSEFLKERDLVKLLISGEDHRFFFHNGYDIIAIIRAIYKRLFKKKLEGASTIDQQIVRVITNDYRRCISRKIKEIILATTVRENIPEIYVPSIYLRLAYYGWRMNNLDQALKRLHFSKEELSIEQAAEIVARIKYPEPKFKLIRRNNQIFTRKNHLQKLYLKHDRGSNYIEINKYINSYSDVKPIPTIKENKRSIILVSR